MKLACGTRSCCLAVLLAVPAASLGREASYALGAGRARELGWSLRDGQNGDPWTGYVIDAGAAPAPDFGRLRDETLKAMASGEGVADADERSCARGVARLVAVQGTAIRLGDVGAADADYDPAVNAINISGARDKAYLRSEANLRRKIIHESLHLIQAIPADRLLSARVPAQDRRSPPCETLHEYAQRDVVLRRLRASFPEASRCALPEVPAAARGSVPNCVYAGGHQVSAPTSTAPRELRDDTFRLPPRLPPLPPEILKELQNPFPPPHQ